MVKTAIVLGMVLAATGPAWAEHRTLVPPEAAQPADDKSVEFDLKIGRDGFRLGSRLFGKDGLLGGAWLNGETRRDGFSLDGRVEHEGKAHNFKFNADIDEWMQRILRWRGGNLDL